jgi:hypothetical protein
MATVNKDFKVKNGLIVEGTTAKVNNYDILTKKTDDQTYIVNLIGGTATSANEANKVVKRDGSGNFAAGTITADLVGDVTGNADTATTLETARTIELTGDVTGQVNFNGSQNVQISTTLNGSFATDAEVATAKSEAIADAATYTNGRETAITTAYQSYAAEADAISTASADATSKANAALASANSYTDDEVAQEVLDRNSAISSAIATEVTDRNSAISTAITNLDLANTYDALGSAATAESNANTYTNTAISNLVDGAPALLDTLNELAAAIADDENFATTVTTSLGLKADTTYVDSEVSDAITTAASDATAKANTAESNANSYTDAEIAQEVTDRNSAISSAISTEVTNRNTAINAAIAQEVIDRDAAITTAVNAIDTDDIEEGSTNLYFTNQRAIDAVGGTIGDAIDELTTDDIEEGSNNLYYTTSRAQFDAASLLTGATLTNIQITGDGSITNPLVITAENGVADSTTSDLAEGSRLYFTDARAVDALEAVVPNFTAVELNSVAKQVAATAEVETASTNNAISWLKADYRSAEFLVKIANGSHTDVSKVILTLDTSDNVAITEYAMVGTNGSLGSVSADVSGNDVRLRVTTANNNSNVTVVGTLLA